METQETSASPGDGIVYLQPTLSLHTFRDKVLDQDVYFQVLKLKDSFYVWFGKSENFGDLSVAMATLKGTVSSTSLIGGLESHSVSLAERLSKKTGKQVFVGGEMKTFDHLQYPLVEKRIMEEMARNPDKF